MTIRTELDELASAVMAKAQEDKTALDAMVEALKVCATYYAICEKVKAKSGDDSGADDFNSFQKAIHGTQESAHGGRNARIISEKQPPPGGQRGN